MYMNVFLLLVYHILNCLSIVKFDIIAILKIFAPNLREMELSPHRRELAPLCKT